VLYEGWLDYIVRKIDRSGGDQIVLTDRERRWPLIFCGPRYFITCEPARSDDNSDVTTIDLIALGLGGWPPWPRCRSSPDGRASRWTRTWRGGRRPCCSVFRARLGDVGHRSVDARPGAGHGCRRTSSTTSGSSSAPVPAWRSRAQLARGRAGWSCSAPGRHLPAHRRAPRADQQLRRVSWTPPWIAFGGVRVRRRRVALSGSRFGVAVSVLAVSRVPAG